MTSPRETVAALTGRAGRLAAHSERMEEGRKYEEAFCAMEAAQALDSEARSVAVASGDAELMSLWELT